MCSCSSRSVSIPRKKQELSRSFTIDQASVAAIREELEKIEKMSYIAVSTGFWYEWSLGISSAFGFDFANRAVTYFDKGETKITTSTWPQVCSSYVS